MGKKKKQEKSKKQKEIKKQKEKLKKSEKTAQKAGSTEKGKDKSKDESKVKRDKAVIPENKDRISEAAECFRALGDENRLRILVLLGDRELCAGDILKSVSIVQSTLSHHMKILVDSGLVKCRRQGKWSYYSLNQRTREMLGSLTGRQTEKEKNTDGK